jgi:hypothetical protein
MVSVDVRPGSSDNHIQLGSSGLVPVALLGSADVNAASIDPASVRFAGAYARTRKDGSTIFTIADVNGDGIPDLSLGFDTETLHLAPGATVAYVCGRLTDGRPLQGQAAVNVGGTVSRAYGKLRPREGDQTAVLALRAGSVWPNPARAGSTMELTLATDEPASLEVWTVTGRLVSRRDLGAMGAGSHAVDLSETRALPNGVYFVRVLQGSLSSGTRVIVQH